MNSPKIDRHNCIGRQRRGFTLNEVVVSLAASSLLLVGMGSTIYLATRATTDEGRPNTRVVHSSLSLNDLMAELHYATSFHERLPHAVEFSVADRGGDGVAEVIRYEWSGNNGESLTRTENGGSPIVVAENVYAFQLEYNVQTVLQPGEQPESTPTTPTEVLAASFNGWSGITPTTSFRTTNPGYWLSEYFELAWPGGATTFNVTRLRLKVGQASSSGQFSIGFYVANGGVGPLASSTMLGSEQSHSSAGLPSTPDWKEFTFNNVTMTDPTSGYVILVKGLATGGKIGYLQSLSAPQDATVMKYSTNSGGTWSPSASTEKLYDAPFEVYGVFSGGEMPNETADVERFFVRSVKATLQTGGSIAERVSSAIDILNAPEVAAP